MTSQDRFFLKIEIFGFQELFIIPPRTTNYFKRYKTLHKTKPEELRLIMAAMITIACGRPSSSRRRTTQQRSNTLSAYMPKGLRSTQSGVTQRRTTVAKKVQPKSFRSNYRVPTTEAMKPTGRWTSKLQVKDATTVAHTTRYQPKVRVQVQVDEASAKKKDWEARHAYWMKKEGERKGSQVSR